MFNRSKKICDEDYESFLQWYSNLPISSEADFVGLQSNIAPCNPPKPPHRKACEKNIDGKITVLNENHGLINDYIYFDKKSTGIQSQLSNDSITVGTHVNVHAYTDHTNCWCAHTVRVLYNIGGNWNENYSLFKSQRDCGSVIGVITSLDHETGIGYIEEDVKFKIKEVDPLYIPFVNDWVNATIKPNNTASGIRPVRVVDMTGTITSAPRRHRQNHSLHSNFGLINHEVSFESSTCLEDYSPHVGDQVICSAVESRQGKYQLRATSVKLLQRHKSKADPSNSLNEKSWSIKGLRPQMESGRKSVPSFLPQYALPKALYECVVDGGDVLKSQPVLLENLSMTNFAKRYTALLFLEEVASKIETSQFSLKGIHLETRGEFTYLNVPGIIDGRPDLSIGDIVILQECNDKGYAPDYKGFIHHICVEEEYILVKFHNLLNENNMATDTFDVFFSYSRTPYRRCHLAVNFAQKNFIARYFNTTEKINDMMNTPVKEPFFLHNESLNYRQLMAVKQVMALRKGCSPYVLFGPPGTGKTVTVVEMILQIFCTNSQSRILVCAPSNSAVDVICERLHLSGKVEQSDMIRFNCMRRVEESIPKNVRLYCKKEEEVEKVARYRIILSTCVNVGMFYNLNLKNSHITHLFIDEVGQATEPETLIPIGLCYNEVVVMAGDPKQLGPVIKSPLALHYGLNCSLVERLMDIKCYQRQENGEYNPSMVTKLIINYRVSDKHLLCLSSDLFYDNELVADQETWCGSKFSKWSHLPNNKFPMLFHGIIGKEMKESGSPSWMNPAEILQIVRYVKLLQSELNVEESDIGIISPYRKQVQKLRLMLAGVNIHGIKIGTVEEFQGQERQIIIVSTVRSQAQSAAKDTHFRVDLGFLSNPKRFNVSITRCKSLFIVVGNPLVLKFDKYWNKLLMLCFQNKGYVGCPFL